MQENPTENPTENIEEKAVENLENQQVSEETEPAQEPTADEKYAELHDKYLRLNAEFDNFRKRTTREKILLLQTAAADTLKDLLPIIDDFERAFQNIQNPDDPNFQGFKLIFDKLIQTTASKGLKEIQCLNKTFDADMHEAITQIPAPSPEMKGKIIDVIQKGYAINETIIRYPKVVIGQ